MVVVKRKSHCHVFTNIGDGLFEVLGYGLGGLGGMVPVSPPVSPSSITETCSLLVWEFGWLGVGFINARKRAIKYGSIIVFV